LGNVKFAFKGPLPAEESSRTRLIVALVMTILFALSAWRRTGRPSTRSMALLGIAGYLAGYVAVAQWNYLDAANRSWLEWAATSAWSVTGWTAYALICFRLARWADGSAQLHRPASAADVLHSLGYGQVRSNVAPLDIWSRSLGVLRVLFLFGLAYVSIALAYDGRGRDFPVALIGLPIAGFALLEFAATSSVKRTLANEELLLAITILVSTLVVAWIETPRNMRAMAWCALCALCAATLFVGYWRAVRQDQRAEQQADAAQLERV
ncbi:MAG TPA: hypothetical protein VET48_12760, partial [Steroidobacteraceae bacterium]|nr:hypothetical protein [Steroidobacteraceae bacterium]